MATEKTEKKPAAAKTEKAAPAAKAAAKPAEKKEKKAAKASMLYKSELEDAIMNETGLKRQQVELVLKALPKIVSGAVKGGKTEIVIPGVVRMRRVVVPARDAFTGLHPVTKKEHQFKARPQSVKAKVTVSKEIRELLKA
jgi:hypothetical protein